MEEVDKRFSSHDGSKLRNGAYRMGEVDHEKKWKRTIDHNYTIDQSDYVGQFPLET